MMRKSFSSLHLWLCIIACITCLPVSILAGCSNSTNDLIERETLTQVSTIDALLGGVYDGVTDFKTLKDYGDFGISTFEGLDGEGLGFDGEFYQVKANGVAYPVTDSMLTPFASVTFFDVDLEENLLEGMDYEQLPDFMENLLPTANIFYALRIDGQFSYVKTRSVPAQEKPYPPLAEVTANQPEFEFNDVEGVIVGFICPDYVSGVNVPGYHLHFLTSDKNAGGHVLAFTVKQAVISVDYTSEFLMILPGEGSNFYQLDLTGDSRDEIDEVEK
jgi:acetolactate decarboxylase